MFLRQDWPCRVAVSLYVGNQWLHCGHFIFVFVCAQLAMRHVDYETTAREGRVCPYDSVSPKAWYFKKILLLLGRWQCRKG